MPGGKDATKIEAVKGETYTIYCTLPGHRAAGMHATITVGAAGRRRRGRHRHPHHDARRRPDLHDRAGRTVRGGPVPAGRRESDRKLMARRSFTTAAAVALGVAALAGCGSSSGGGAYKQPTGKPVETIRSRARRTSSARIDHRAGGHPRVQAHEHRHPALVPHQGRRRLHDRGGCGQDGVGQGEARARASTPSTATSPGTRVPGWKAPSPSSSPDPPLGSRR